MALWLKSIFDKQDLERRLIAFYAVAAIIVTLIFSIMITFYGSWGLGLAMLLMACNNLPVLFLLKHRINIKKSCYYLISNVTFTITFSVCFVGGLEGPVHYWLGILPFGGGLLLRVRGIIFGTIMAFMSLIITALRDFIPGVHDVLVPDLVYVTISLCCFVTMISFMAYLYLQANAIVVTNQTRKLDNLLNIVTHDIANPLTLISGHAELLITQGQSPAHNQALLRISRASDLINEILRKVRQIQAAKAGKLQIQTIPVSLAEIFDKLRFVFEDRLHKKRQQLHINLPAIFHDVYIEAEPVMLLNEVLSNLLSNAMKFSPSGSTISINVARQQDFMRIEVKDQGIGIPKELLPHIFDDFRSTSRVGTEGEAGTGFGLPLARHIVEAFGGTLHVQSRSADEHRKNSGTVFIMLLPIHRAATPQTKAS